jgi:AcrR family transcriptional regulator
VVTEPGKADRRRETGERTRERLLCAARGLLAEHGEEAVTLRDITAAAEANVAAVSYHFGSKDALCRAAVEDAIDAIVEGQIAEFEELPDDASLADVAAVWAQPIIRSLTTRAECAHDLQMRVVARAAAGSPELRKHLRTAIERAEPTLLTALQRALPDVPADELRIRLHCVRGMFNSLSAGNALADDLKGRDAAEVERFLLPVITGALAGGSPAGKRRRARQPAHAG